MKYSIVIPALNEEKNIALCINEIKKQESSTEIIRVDGMSTDKTIEIANELGAVTLKEKKNKILLPTRHQKQLPRASGLTLLKIFVICA